MSDINIFVIEVAEARKKLKKFMTPRMREALDQAGLEVDMESGEEIRDELPEGLPGKFVVPEEVLFFPHEKGETEDKKKARRRMKDLNNKKKRKRVPGSMG